MTGICTSISMMLGDSRSASSTATAPFSAVPTTSMRGYLLPLMVNAMNPKKAMLLNGFMLINVVLLLEIDFCFQRLTNS